MNPNIKEEEGGKNKGRREKGREGEQEGRKEVEGEGKGRKEGGRKGKEEERREEGGRGAIPGSCFLSSLLGPENVALLSKAVLRRWGVLGCAVIHQLVLEGG